MLPSPAVSAATGSLNVSAFEAHHEFLESQSSVSVLHSLHREAAQQCCLSDGVYLHLNLESNPTGVGLFIPMCLEPLSGVFCAPQGPHMNRHFNQMP